MDFYDFTVTNFRIYNTRARVTDTLRLGHAIYVDGDVVAVNLVSLGDFDNGDYNPQDYVQTGDSPGLNGVVINDPSANVAFIFQLLNAGNVPEGALSGRVVSTFDQLAGVAANLAGAGAANAGAAMSSSWFYIAIGIEAMADLWAWLYVDCDGPVAVDQISGPRYIVDAWADDYPMGTIRILRRYPGSESPAGCNGSNSLYEVEWLLRHYRGWAQVANPTDGPFKSDVAVSAATHNGAVHAFGVVPAVGVTHARSFTGAAWSVDELGSFDLANLNLPVNAVSFDDRLYVFAILQDGTVSSLAYTVDGGSWIRHITGPIGLRTAEPIATTVFRNRLYLFVRDSTAGSLNATSSADLESWNPWVQIPQSGPSPASPVAAAALGDTLHVFGVHQRGNRPATAVVVHNSTNDGNTWAGWDIIEAGAQPEGEIRPAQPLDVAATVFRDRVYIASRWEAPNRAGENSYYVALNFSGDGENWSGWRRPESVTSVQPRTTAGLAAVGNHLYVVSPLLDFSEFPDNTLVFVH
jgi:hypothetical protein